ncbi:NAD(P)/FAD-dependent oxidoreductase [Rhizobium puerariae]|uniref:NAD(P)/FAD-dependent oxidoreductase n=1 Tax=Rhizobium puerariae TaxID=1585791 RepID=A0ABV6AIQ8_9HYPH
MTRKAVVIGGGAIGAMCALEILRRGLSVTILEPGEPGGEQAASFGNAGWLSSHSVLPPSEPGLWKKVPGYLLDPLGPLAIRPRRFPAALPWLLRYLAAGSSEEKLVRTAEALRSLLEDAPRLHARIAAEAGIRDLVRDDGGLLHIYPDRATFGREARAWRIRSGVGIEWQEMDDQSLHAMEPDLSPEYRFGVLVGEAGHCSDPGAYVAGLTGYAVARGASLLKTRATGFSFADGRLRAVRTGTGDVPADIAVIAAGIFSQPLARAAGDRIPLESERGYHVAIDAPEIVPSRPMMVHDRKIVITPVAGRLRAAGQVEIAGIAAAPNWQRAEILKQHLLATFPGLARDGAVGRLHAWQGHRPSTPDGLPCIGPSRATADVLHAFGHGHVGLASSARTGRLIGQIVAGEPPEIPLAPFSPKRFR